MAVFKCKMCGGSLEVAEGLSVTTCEYCGTTQTLPRLNDDKIANLYDRANHFRRSNDYDKAMGIYEQILNEDSSDSEAYWSLVLCRYGIEYVEDPATKKRIPTVNRTQFTSIFSDEDYKSALQYADDEQKAIYEEEAKAIDNLMSALKTGQLVIKGKGGQTRAIDLSAKQREIIQKYLDYARCSGRDPKDYLISSSEKNGVKREKRSLQNWMSYNRKYFIVENREDLSEGGKNKEPRQFLGTDFATPTHKEPMKTN